MVPVTLKSGWNRERKKCLFSSNCVSSRIYFFSVSGKKTSYIFVFFLLAKSARLTCALAFFLNEKVYAYSNGIYSSSYLWFWVSTIASNAQKRKKFCFVIPGVVLLCKSEHFFIKLWHDLKRLGLKIVRAKNFRIASSNFDLFFSWVTINKAKNYYITFTFEENSLYTSKNSLVSLFPANCQKNIWSKMSKRAAESADSSSQPPIKKVQFEPILIGPISTLEEMDMKVLQFQNKKLAQVKKICPFIFFFYLKNLKIFLLFRRVGGLGLFGP